MKILKKSKQEQGITLIALVVTIIVLLILAGVTISAVMGENGLFQKASTAREINERENVKEDVTLAWGSVQMEGLPNNTSLADKAAQLETELKKKDASATVTVSTEDANVLEVSYKGYSINLNASNDTVTYIAKNGTSGGNNNNNNNNQNNNENNNNNNNNNNSYSYTVLEPGFYEYNNGVTGAKIAAINPNANADDSNDKSGNAYYLSNGMCYVIADELWGDSDLTSETTPYNSNVLARVRPIDIDDNQETDSELGISSYKLVLPSNIESIGCATFYYRDRMKYLVVPDSVRILSFYAFDSDVEDRVIEIGSNIDYFDGNIYAIENINLRSVTANSWNKIKAALQQRFDLQHYNQYPSAYGTNHIIKYLGTEQQFLAATGFSSLAEATGENTPDDTTDDLIVTHTLVMAQQ